MIKPFPIFKIAESIATLGKFNLNSNLQKELAFKEVKKTLPANVLLSTRRNLGCGRMELYMEIDGLYFTMGSDLRLSLYDNIEEHEVKLLKYAGAYYDYFKKQEVKTVKDEEC